MDAIEERIKNDLTYKKLYDKIIMIEETAVYEIIRDQVNEFNQPISIYRKKIEQLRRELRAYLVRKYGDDLKEVPKEIIHPVNPKLYKKSLLGF